MVKEVLKDTPGAAAIFTVGMDREIKIPLIQYEETDWAFIKRLASHFSSALIPDCRVAKPWFWFGMRERGDNCALPELEYQSCVSGKFYEMGGREAGLRRSGFFYYLVRDTGNHRIGDIAAFRGSSFLICGQRARFERGEIVFTYQLGLKTLIGEREYYNERITGMSLGGTVVKTQGELVWMHLDIDGERMGATYPYYWVPTGGNLMYCMPKLGTRASLYIPSHDEREARAANSPRTNGAACPDMEDYNRRYLTTEHGKRMCWFPEAMGLVGTSGEATPLHIMLDDVNCILMESHRTTRIIARDEVILEAPTVSMSTPTELETIRSWKEIEARDSLIVPKGTWGGPKNPPTGSGDTGFTLQFQHDILGVQGVLCGDEFNKYTDYTPDMPPEKEPFDEGGWWRNLVCGVVASVVVGVAIVATGGAAAIAIGAAMGGLAVTATIAIEDRQDGQVRDLETAMLQTAGGMVIGAITGGFVSAAAPAGTALSIGKAAVLDAVSGIGMRTASSLGMEYATTQEKLGFIYDRKAIGFDMALGGLFQGIINKSTFGTFHPTRQQLDMYNASVGAPKLNTPIEDGTSQFE